jgi:hypothetical protein
MNTYFDPIQSRPAAPFLDGVNAPHRMRAMRAMRE